MLVTRVLSTGGRLLGMQLWTSAFATLWIGGLIAWGSVHGDGAGPAMLAASLPRAEDVLLVAGLGVLGVAGHQLLAHGLARAEASLVAPMQYLEIVSATALGWLVFGNLPDAPTWAGTAVIVGAGLYVFHRERRVETGA